MILPELTLIERALARFGGQRRIGEGVGEITPDDLESVAVLRAELLEDTSLVPRLTLRSAKVPIFHQGNGRAGRPEGGITRQAGRAELGWAANVRPIVNSRSDSHETQEHRAGPEPTLVSRTGLVTLAAGLTVRGVFGHC